MKRFYLILSAITILCAACAKTETAKVEVSTETLTVPAIMGNYNVDVTANCAWTAELRDENGDNPVWADITKSIGNGNGTITFRVYENTFNIERKAMLTIKSNGKQVATVALVQESAGGEGTLSADFRIGTYNLRMSNLDKSDPDNNWEVRKDRLAQSIRDCKFDVFAVEEVSTEQQTWLATEFATEYECWFFSPYAANGRGDKAHGILYKKGQFNFDNTHYFWMGDDPHTISQSDTGTEGDFNRGGCCATLTHKASTVKFFFMATHACLNRDPNDKYAHIYADMEKEYNTEGLASFFVGDMNARNTTDAYAEWAQYWKDAYVNADSKTGIGNTYNGFKSASGSSRIDFIFYRGAGIKAKMYTCDNTRYGNLYASDHFPVMLDCTITVNK